MSGLSPFSESGLGFRGCSAFSNFPKHPVPRCSRARPCPPRLRQPCPILDCPASGRVPQSKSSHFKSVTQSQEFRCKNTAQTYSSLRSFWVKILWKYSFVYHFALNFPHYRERSAKTAFCNRNSAQKINTITFSVIIELWYQEYTFFFPEIICIIC